ncbi:MAG: efflux RND transporter periplasmic adaptor subunit [bacterium]
MNRSSTSRATSALLVSAFVACSGGTSENPRADSGRTANAQASPTDAHDIALSAAQASRIRVATVAMSAYRATVQTTGTVAFNGDRSTQVLAPVSGPVTKILVNPGSAVRRGQALATVTSPDFATAMAAYRKSQSAYRNAQRISELDDQLFKNDAIPRRELEQAQTDATSALADRDAAMEQLRALGVDEAAITAVRDNKPTAAPEAVIRAPIDGVVVEKLVNQGQLIQAGTTQVFTVADLSTVWVMANVFETDLGAVRAGENATITTSAYPTPITGTVTYVGALVDPASKATAVRVLVQNPRGILKRDMLVNVAIRASEGQNGILIPTSAVLRDDQNLPFVYVALPNNHFARRPITIGSRVGDSYEVRAGLTAGERIVVDGALFLQFAGSQ